MYRTNWIDRWEQLTGTRPDDNLYKPPSWDSHRSVHHDAIKPASRKFIRRRKK